MKKVKYIVKWENIVVGVVYNNSQNNYVYEPNIENIRKCAARGMPCISVMTPQRKWKKQLPEFIVKNLNGEPVYNTQEEREMFNIISPNVKI